MGGREREHVGPERCAEQLLEPVDVEHRGLGQEREDAAAVVVDDDDPQVDVASAERDERIGVMDEREITDEHESGRAVGGLA